jgi:hypothetical protein
MKEQGGVVEAAPPAVVKQADVQVLFSPKKKDVRKRLLADLISDL